MSYFEDDILDDEVSLSLNFEEMTVKLKKELQELEILTKEDNVKEKIKKIINMLEWYY
jgi:hypothetical protein